MKVKCNNLLDNDECEVLNLKKCPYIMLKIPISSVVIEITKGKVCDWVDLELRDKFDVSLNG